MVRSECFDTCEMQLFRKGTLTQAGGFGFVFSISGSFVALPSIASLGQIHNFAISWDDSNMFCQQPEVDVLKTIKNPRKLLDGHLKKFSHWHFAGRDPDSVTLSDTVTANHALRIDGQAVCLQAPSDWHGSWWILSMYSNCQQLSLLRVLKEPGPCGIPISNSRALTSYLAFGDSFWDANVAVIENWRSPCTWACKHM